MRARGVVAQIRNVEIKARCSDPDAVRRRLETVGAKYVGLDEQRDTYFKVPSGRLKLREGTIENNLIAYDRADEATPRLSEVTIFGGSDLSELRRILVSRLPVSVVVEKRRHIYYLDNVKIHVDTVPRLGHFVEIEAADPARSAGTDDLDRQCRRVMTLLGVDPARLVARSYSDLLASIQSAPLWRF